MALSRSFSPQPLDPALEEGSIIHSLIVCSLEIDTEQRDSRCENALR